MSSPDTFARIVSTTAWGSLNCTKRGGRMAAVNQFNRLRTSPPRSVPAVKKRGGIVSLPLNTRYVKAYLPPDGNPGLFKGTRQVDPTDLTKWIRYNLLSSTTGVFTTEAVSDSRTPPEPLLVPTFRQRAIEPFERA